METLLGSTVNIGLTKGPFTVDTGVPLVVYVRSTVPKLVLDQEHMLKTFWEILTVAQLIFAACFDDPFYSSILSTKSRHIPLKQEGQVRLH